MSDYELDSSADTCDEEADIAHYLAVFSEPGVAYCNSTFDSFSCWPTTRAGGVAMQRCPDVSITNPTANATKACHENGTWAAAEYGMCFLDTPRKDHIIDNLYISNRFSVRIILDIGYTTATIALLVALCIFTYFKSLRCLRNAIHSNLIVAFILNNISWVIVRNTLVELSSTGSQWLCRAAVTAVSYFHSTVFYWMFVEGLYLFTIIVWAFSAQKIRLWYYLIIGWVVPMVVTAIWAILKAHFDNLVCWLPTGSAFEYVVHGPVLFILASNVFFIVAIIWVLVTKMRASNTLETRQSRKALKATIVLVPLLGLTYVLFLGSPVQDHVINDVFNHINAVFQSLQGLFVAIFYCFLNGEVQSLIRQKLNALQDSRTLSRYTKSSFFGSPRRSSCYAMAVTTCNGTTAGGPKRTSGASAQSRVSRTAEAETEASAAMMDNML